MSPEGSRCPFDNHTFYLKAGQHTLMA